MFLPLVLCGCLWLIVGFGLSFFWSISMSVEKIFQSESVAFLFVSCGLFAVLVVVCGLLARVLWCVSAWFVVRFNIG